MYDAYTYAYGFDWTYLLLIVAAIFSLIAQTKVKSTYNKYSKVRSMTGMTGREAAERILAHKGIRNVEIRHVSGTLTDHYNPANNTVNLSDAVYNSASVAAVSVAAHECGHVMQHHEDYTPILIRSKLVPIANFGSYAAWPLILLGLFFGGGTSTLLIEIGILLFSASVLFQLVTLPVEFDASARADRTLQELGILSHEEAKMTKKVLGAAALTYVAAAATAIIQLLRLLLILNRRRD